MNNHDTFKCNVRSGGVDSLQGILMKHPNEQASQKLKQFNNPKTTETSVNDCKMISFVNMRTDSGFEQKGFTFLKLQNSIYLPILVNC